VLLLGPGDTAAHQRLAGVRQILHAPAAHFAAPVAEDVAHLLQVLADRYSVILSSHSSLARSALPRVAASLDVGMQGDVLAICGNDCYVRPAYAGNLMSSVENAPGLQILTIRGSRFEAVALDGNAELVEIDSPAADGRVRVTGFQTAGGERPDLGEARVVISGGRSLGSAERFRNVLDPLAKHLGAALGATRAAVDAGYAPNEWQVGQTGTIVAPDLYIAVGVSGAIQHTAGIRDSKIIVAINKDPEAPIMKVADYALVADLFIAVPELLGCLESAAPPESGAS